MKTVAALVRKEIAGRWALLLAAFALGCVPFLLPLLPGPQSTAPAELREASLWTIAAIGSALLAMLLGADLMSRELAERRMGFYFSRPISAGALWTGKLVAAYLVLVAGTTLLILPVLLVDWRHIALGEELRPIVAGVFAGLLLALLAASAIAVLVRARSAWLALDGLAIALTIAISVNTTRRLLAGGALESATLGLVVLGAVSICALFAAHRAALDLGRTDLRAVRRALALRLWALLLPTAAGFAAFGLWVLSPSPQDLAAIWNAHPAPSGPWMEVDGPLRGRFGLAGSFLWQSENDRYFRVHAAGQQSNPNPIVFSGNGKVAAWLESEGGSFTVWTLDLTTAGTAEQAPVKTTASYSARPRAIALSPSGRNLAANVADRWILEDLGGGRILASATASEFVTGVRWQSDDRVRIFSLSGFDDPVVTAAIWDLAPGVRSAAADVHVELHSHPVLKASPDGTHALLHDASGWSLLDVATGARVATFSSRNGAPDPGIPSRQPAFLPDGGLITSREENGQRHLARFDANGGLLRDYDLGAARSVWAGGMTNAHTLLLSLVDSRSSDAEGVFSSRLVSLDLDSGEMRQLGRNTGFPWYGESWTEALQGDAARWCISARGQLLYLDPTAGFVRRLGPPDS